MFIVSTISWKKITITQSRSTMTESDGLFLHVKHITSITIKSNHHHPASCSPIERRATSLPPLPLKKRSEWRSSRRLISRRGNSISSNGSCAVKKALEKSFPTACLARAWRKMPRHCGRKKKMVLLSSGRFFLEGDAMMDARRADWSHAAGTNLLTPQFLTPLFFFSFLPHQLLQHSFMRMHCCPPWQAQTPPLFSTLLSYS